MTMSGSDGRPRGAIAHGVNNEHATPPPIPLDIRADCSTHPSGYVPPPPNRMQQRVRQRFDRRCLIR